MITTIMMIDFWSKYNFNYRNNMVFTSKHKEITKSEKLFKKDEKNIFWDFFRYDVIQERAWFRAFVTPIFKNFFRTVFKQSENQTLKISSQFSK